MCEPELRQASSCLLVLSTSGIVGKDDTLLILEPELWLIFLHFSDSARNIKLGKIKLAPSSVFYGPPPTKTVICLLWSMMAAWNPKNGKHPATYLIQLTVIDLDISDTTRAKCWETKQHTPAPSCGGKFTFLDLHCAWHLEVIIPLTVYK